MSDTSAAPAAAPAPPFVVASQADLTALSAVVGQLMTMVRAMASKPEQGCSFTDRYEAGLKAVMRVAGGGDPNAADDLNTIRQEVDHEDHVEKLKALDKANGTSLAAECENKRNAHLANRAGKAGQSKAAQIAALQAQLAELTGASQ